MRYLMMATALMITLSSVGQDVIGKWKTIDDETGNAKSIVELFEKDGKYHGKVIEILWTADGNLDPSCDKCEDDRANRKVIGMDILRDMEKDDDEFDDGTILDPKNGKIYDCKFWLDEEDPNILHVRGYIAFFFRTQKWVRV